MRYQTNVMIQATGCGTELVDEITVRSYWRTRDRIADMIGMYLFSQVFLRLWRHFLWHAMTYNIESGAGLYSGIWHAWRYRLGDGFMQLGLGSGVRTKGPHHLHRITAISCPHFSNS